MELRDRESNYFVSLVSMAFHFLDSFLTFDPIECDAWSRACTRSDGRTDGSTTCISNKVWKLLCDFPVSIAFK